MGALTIIGSKEDAIGQLKQLQKQVKFNELIVNSFIYDEDKWLNSYKLFSEVAKDF